MLMKYAEKMSMCLGEKKKDANLALASLVSPSGLWHCRSLVTAQTSVAASQLNGYPRFVRDFRRDRAQANIDCSSK